MTLFQVVAYQDFIVPDRVGIDGEILQYEYRVARGKFLRGTRLDPFGYLAERKTERWMMVTFTILPELTRPNSSDPLFRETNSDWKLRSSIFVSTG